MTKDSTKTKSDVIHTHCLWTGIYLPKSNDVFWFNEPRLYKSERGARDAKYDMKKYFSDVPNNFIFQVTKLGERPSLNHVTHFVPFPRGKAFPDNHSKYVANRGIR